MCFVSVLSSIEPAACIMRWSLGFLFRLVSSNWIRLILLPVFASRAGKYDFNFVIITCRISILLLFIPTNTAECRSQWPRGLRRRSAAARLLRSWVRIPPEAWMFVCCECCVLSGRGLCDELITRPEESYRLWCVVVCDFETSRMREPWLALRRGATGEKKK